MEVVSVIIEGPTLEGCRQEAASRLRVAPDQLRLEVLQRGETDLFSRRPFRVRARPRTDGPDVAGSASPLSARIDDRLELIAKEMETLGLLDRNRETTIFEQCVDEYEKLSEERRQEIREITELLSGPLAQKVQARIGVSASARLMTKKGNTGTRRKVNR